MFKQLLIIGILTGASITPTIIVPQEPEITEDQKVETLKNNFRKKLSAERAFSIFSAIMGALGTIWAVYCNSAVYSAMFAYISTSSAFTAVDIHNLIKRYDKAMADLDKLMAATDTISEQSA